MRTIETARSFRRDLKRARRGPVGSKLDDLLQVAIELLAANGPMPPRYRDHPLSGDWKDHRDCHLRPDLVHIYRKPDADTLQLVRLGSHSELGI